MLFLLAAILQNAAPDAQPQSVRSSSPEFTATLPADFQRITPPPKGALQGFRRPVQSGSGQAVVITFSNLGRPVLPEEVRTPPAALRTRLGLPESDAIRISVTPTPWGEFEIPLIEVRQHLQGHWVVMQAAWFPLRHGGLEVMCLAPESLYTDETRRVFADVVRSLDGPSSWLTRRQVQMTNRQVAARAVAVILLLLYGIAHVFWFHWRGGPPLLRMLWLGATALACIAWFALTWFLGQALSGSPSYSYLATFGVILCVFAILKVRQEGVVEV